LEFRTKRTGSYILDIPKSYLNDEIGSCHTIVYQFSGTITIKIIPNYRRAGGWQSNFMLARIGDIG
jgi:hypothetical protein